MTVTLPTCSVCQTALDGNGTCARCRAPADWGEQVEAIDFVQRRLDDWQRAGRITDRQLGSLADHYTRRRQEIQSAIDAKQVYQAAPGFSRNDECWSCQSYLYQNSSHCSECGAPITNPGVKSLRYWRYLQHELQVHEEAGLLTLRQAHEFLADTNERIDALQRKLERERAVQVIPVVEAAAPPPPRRRAAEPVALAEPEGPRRTVLEVLLDPQSIQWLLAGGGALFVLGLVIWFASIGLFSSPIFVAIALGVGNAALLGGGWALILMTRFHNAGRALTLLACLVMPLNLWFYHLHGIFTLENHLWIAALVCCIVYTASAFVLKDALFVYVLVAGITLTGLLILAQEREHIEQVFLPTVLLVGLGMIALHAERAFPPGDSPFSRERFGMAFYWSSQGLFAAGLLLLLGAQFAGWLHEPVFRHFGMRRAPDVSSREFLPWTLVIVLIGTYAYIYSDLVVRRIGVYLYLAAITLLWAEIHVLVLTGLTDTGAIVIITLALTGLAINVLQATFESEQSFLRRVFPLGLVLSILPVLFGVVLHFRAVNIILNDNWQMVIDGARVKFEITWPHVLAMAITAACCRVGAHLYRHTFRSVSIAYFFATAAATLVFAAGLLWMTDLKQWDIDLRPWEVEAPILMLIPILYLIAGHLYKGHTAEKPLVWCGHAATVIMIVSSIWVALGITPQVVRPVEGDKVNLLLAAFCFEAAVFYGLAGILHRSQASMYFAAVMFCGAIWQLLQFFHTPQEAYVVAFALSGFVLLVVYRLGVFESLAMPNLDRAIFQSANALATIGFVAGALLALSRALMSERQLANLDNPQGGGVWEHPIQIVMGLLIFLCVISIASALLAQHPMWRRVYVVLTIVNAVLIAVMIHKLSTLSPWQKLEIFTIVVGVALLAAAYLGWYRETERASDLVSIAFVFGSIALIAPMFLAIVIYRFHHDYTPGWDDLGLVVGCIALFGSGVVCRIRATTLIGGFGMVSYVIVVLIGLHRHLADAAIIGIYLTLGGGLLFGTGLVLSIYRDRLLALPAKVRRREGIFRIFDWR